MNKLDKLARELTEINQDLQKLYRMKEIRLNELEQIERTITNEERQYYKIRDKLIGAAKE